MYRSTSLTLLFLASACSHAPSTSATSSGGASSGSGFTVDQRQIDTSFGKVAVDVKPAGSTSFTGTVTSPSRDSVVDIDGNETIQALAVDAAGNVLAAGVVTSGSGATLRNDFVVARYLSTGSPDTTFGDSGVRVFKIHNGDPPETNYNANRGAIAVSATANGKILVAGSATVVSANYDDYVVLRLNADGSLDSTFGNAGVASADVSHVANVPTGFVELPSGQLLIGGNNSQLVAFTSGGVLDSTFGTAGVGDNAFPAAYNKVLGMRTIPSGGFLTYGIAEPASSEEVFVAHYLASGKLDTSFGQGGVSTVARDSSGAIIDYNLVASIDTSDNILIAGIGDYPLPSRDPAARFSTGVFWRYGADGKGKFLGTGAFAAFNATLDNAVRGNAQIQAFQPLAVAGDGSGKTIAAGNCQGRFAIARLNSDGSPDDSFGVHGVQLVDFAVTNPISGQAGALLEQADGKWLAGGNVESSDGTTQQQWLAFTRLLP